MKNTITLLLAGFESNSGTTQAFLNFFRTFKREFSKELRSIGATNVQFSIGHFYVSGFFTSVSGQVYYFSLSDVRGMEFSLRNNPDSCGSQLMYRTAQDYKDYSGGGNQWISFKSGMAKEMSIL